MLLQLFQKWLVDVCGDDERAFLCKRLRQSIFCGESTNDIQEQSHVQCPVLQL